MHIDYSNLISIENIFQAWSEFRKGKAKRLDVQIFERNLEDNLFELQHRLKVEYYIRYADDFIFLAKNKKFPYINIRCLDNETDSLRYIVLPYYILARTKTKRRMFKKLKEKIGLKNFNQSLQSYLGYLGHAKSYKLTEKLKNQIWFWLENRNLFPKGIYAGKA